MAVSVQLHSRLVAWLKVVLPLIALAILSTLFLLSRQTPTEGTLPYADVDVNELAREQRLAEPEYSTVTADGASLSVVAKMARPDPARPGASSADDLSARIDAKSGLTVTIASRSGQLDPAANRATFTGNVRVETSTGYRLDSPSLWTSLDRTRLEADGPVAALAPFGTIDAGYMTLTAGDAGYELVFKKGVKLVYDPQSRGTP